MTTQAGTLTDQEHAALAYLNTRMEAGAQSIGRAIYDAALGRGSNLAAIGAIVCAWLRKRGLVTRIPEPRAWRITREGRAVLKAAC